MRRLLFLLLALLALLSSCQGPDLVRLRAERAGYELARRCADGWFQRLPVTPDDERLVRQSLADWDRSLQADERLAGAPLGDVGAAVPAGGGR